MNSLCFAEYIKKMSKFNLKNNIIKGHIINISGSSTIVLNGQQTYTVSVTNNLPVTWTLKNVHSGGTAGGTIVSQTASSCVAKRTTTGAFKIIATIKDTNKSQEMIIN